MTKLILLILGIVLLIISIVYFTDSRRQLRYTAFYYPNAAGTEKTLGIGTVTGSPKYQSQIGQFKTLEECQTWAAEVHKRYHSGLSEDLFFCAKGCSEQGDQVKCLEHQGIVSTFE